MIERICYPLPEGSGCEEAVRLPQPIQLRVAIEHASADELIEDTYDQGREDGEDDIVVRHCPAFKRNLSRVVVEPRVLRRVSYCLDYN